MIRQRLVQGRTLFKKLDLFGQGIPGFTLEGEKHETTILGSLVSIVFIIVVLLYGNLKLNQMVSR